MKEQHLFQSDVTPTTDEALPKKAKAAKSKAEKPKPPDKMPAIRRCLDYFYHAHIERHGFKPIINGGKDANLFKILLTGWSEDEVNETIDGFFATSDPRVLRSDYSVGAFYSLASYLRVQASQPANDRRTMSNMHALARATGRR